HWGSMFTFVIAQRAPSAPTYYFNSRSRKTSGQDTSGLASRAALNVLQPALSLFRIVQVEFYTDRHILESFLTQSYERLVRNFDLQQPRAQPAYDWPGLVTSPYAAGRMVSAEHIALCPLRGVIANKADDLSVGRYEISVGTNFFTH